ncbi:signal peptidase I [Acetivibrio cellulolyticus]|uniref:signal peptidase I n=1 Tax=Acetivibrio cellulolyticus TaxID=35830 RepID=UPI0001E2C6C9|nr:signal peptidase I [Acetivibrio cellulolyticus]
MVHIAIAVVLGVLIVTYVAQITIVNGSSMEKTLHNGDRLIIEKVSPRFGNIHRGDIVTIDDPEKIDKERSPIIKRVIGVEGDLVEINDGKVFVNQNELKEDYINGDNTLVVEENYSKVKVEAGCIYVLGDNRLPGASLDSRSIGQESIDKVNGKALLRFFPFNGFKLF